MTRRFGVFHLVSRTMHSQPRKARFKLTSRFSFGIHWRPSLYCMFKSMSKRQQNYVYGDIVSVSLKSCGKLLQACLQLAVLRRLHQDKFALRTTTGGFLNRSPELAFTISWRDRAYCCPHIAISRAACRLYPPLPTTSQPDFRLIASARNDEP
jgi:hypothetical protein